MSGSAWLFLVLVQAIVFNWPLWIALIAAQIVYLSIGYAHWLPSWLMLIGFVWAMAIPFIWK